MRLVSTNRLPMLTILEVTSAVWKEDPQTGHKIFLYKSSKEIIMKTNFFTLLVIIAAILGVAVAQEAEQNVSPALRYRLQQTRGTARHLMGKGGKGGDDDDDDDDDGKGGKGGKGGKKGGRRRD